MLNIVFVNSKSLMTEVALQKKKINNKEAELETCPAYHAGFY